MARALKAAGLPPACRMMTSMGSLKSIIFQLGSPGAISFYSQELQGWSPGCGVNWCICKCLAKANWKS